MALMGYQPRFNDVQPRGTTMPSIEERVKIIHQIRDEIHASSRIASELVKNRITNPLPSFQKGDEVWLEAKNLRTTHPTAKLAPKRYGPFPIEEMLGPVTAKLRLPPQWKIHPVFHVSLLTPYRTTVENGKKYDKPPAEIVEGEAEFEAEAIVDARWVGDKRPKFQYYVKWKGYPDSDNTWEPPTNLTHTAELLLEFHQRHPDKPHPLQKPPRRQPHKTKVRHVYLPHPLLPRPRLLPSRRHRHLLHHHSPVPPTGTTT